MTTNNRTTTTTVDTGGSIVTLTPYADRGPLAITAYVNGMSIRTPSLDVPRIRDLFIAATVAATGSATDSAKTVAALELSSAIQDIIDTHTT